MLDTEYKFNEVHDLMGQIKVGEERVEFKNIFKTDNGGVALIAFKAGQQLDTHLAPAEVMVYVLEGEVRFTVLDKENTIKTGGFMLLSEGVPHSVVADTDAKLMLVKVKA